MQNAKLSIMDKIAKALRKHTLKEIAAEVGMCESAVWYRLRAKRNKHFLAMKKLADYFGVTLDELYAYLMAQERQEREDQAA
jgi:transcriptional regulator with XRE-family HTH domain